MAGQPGRSGGRNRKPTELKRLLGNPGKRALPAPMVALPPVVRVAAAPRFASGTEMVQHVLDSGASAWIGPTDAAALDMAARLYDAMLGEGDPLRLVRISEGLSRCLSQLGLTPTDRSRLGVAEVKARSKLEELRQKRAARGPRAS